MPDRQVILEGADPSLAQAGRMALEVSLAATAQDAVTVVADESCVPVAASMLAAAEALGATNKAFLLERWGKRPLGRFPNEVFAAFEASQVTVLAVAPLAGELKARLQLLELVPRKQLRHAHLIRVGADAFRVGMRADYRAVNGMQDRLLAVLPTAAHVRVTSPGGTSLDVTFDPNNRWVKSNGLSPSGQVAEPAVRAGLHLPGDRRRCVRRGQDHRRLVRLEVPRPVRVPGDVGVRGRPAARRPVGQRDPGARAVPVRA